ncbi:MAG TPA: DUF4340 domain-containing protein [Geminicoccaceae bacterium]
MNPKVFLILAAITAAATAAAVVAVLSQPAATTLQFVDEPAFPALRENPDAVAKIIISTPEGTITLVRETGDRWAALERHGYPVDRRRVRDLVVALADMRLIERKTAQPEHYDRLEVEAIDAENAQSELLRLEAADGKVLAEAIMGKQRYRLTGTEPSGTYLRRPDDAQSWLASGGIQIDRAVARWLDGEIVDVDPERIRRIEIQRAGEPSYAAVRESPGDELRLAGLADDEALKEDADLSRLTGALSSVRLEDVQPREQLTWPAEQHTARVETFDGVELSVRLAQIDDGYWAIFDARAVAPTDTTASGDAGAAQPTASAGAENAGEADVGDGAAGGEAAPQADAGAGSGAQEGSAPADTAEAEAEPPLDPAQLNQRLAKWAYRIPEHVFNRLSTARSELVGDQDGTS